MKPTYWLMEETIGDMKYLWRPLENQHWQLTHYLKVKQGLWFPYLGDVGGGIIAQDPRKAYASHKFKKMSKLELFEIVL